jgi:hypothetical protein
MLIIILFIIIISLFLLGLKYKLFKLSKKISIAIFLLALCLILLRFGQGLLSAAIIMIPFLLKLLQFLMRNLGLLRFIKYFAKKSQASAKASQNKISKKKAYEILDLDKNATPEQIRAKYRKLIKSNHPDMGGSKYLSSLINNAKDKLLE